MRCGHDGLILPFGLSRRPKDYVPETNPELHPKSADHFRDSFSHNARAAVQSPSQKVGIFIILSSDDLGFEQ
jgi:hypothetical protein